MANNDYIIGAQLVTAGNAATGSFAKLQIVSGAKHTGGTETECVFDSISFGGFTSPETAFTASNVLSNYSHSLDFASNSSTIEGPITRFKLGSIGKVLAYFTKK